MDGQTGRQGRPRCCSGMLSSFGGRFNHRDTCLFCSRYWAFWIWSCVPVMVMMRSSEPSSGSSILMDAPDSWRICLILWPPFPMIDPASCTTSTQTVLGVRCRHVVLLQLKSLTCTLMPFHLHLLGWWLVSWWLGLQYHCMTLCHLWGEGAHSGWFCL